MIRKTITLVWLNEMNACSEARGAFEARFGKRAYIRDVVRELSREALRQESGPGTATTDLPYYLWLWWLHRKLLPDFCINNGWTSREVCVDCRFRRRDCEAISIIRGDIYAALRKVGA